jgi:hypothetical protein
MCSPSNILQALFLEIKKCYKSLPDRNKLYQFSTQSIYFDIKKSTISSIMFTITKAFVAIMAATAVLAAPELKARQATPPLANCDFTLTSNVAVPANTNLVAEFNFG